MASVAPTRRKTPATTRTHTRTKDDGTPYQQKGKARGNGEGTIFPHVRHWTRKDGTMGETVTWRAAVTLPNGKRAEIQGKTYDEVAQRKREMERAKDAGTLVTGPRLTVAAYLGEWLETVARPRVRASTYDSYSMLVRVHLAPALGTKRLAALQPRDVQALLNAKSEAGLSPRTVQYMRAVLRAALEQALQWGLVPRNVAAKNLVQPARGRARSIAPFTQPELAEFFAVVNAPSVAVLLQCAPGTGLRLGELLGLRWQDVAMDAGRLYVHQALEWLSQRPWRFVEPKSESGVRTVPLIGPAVTALKAQRARVLALRLQAGPLWREHDLVFASEGGTPIHPKNVAREFKKTLMHVVHARYLAAGAPYGDAREGLARWVGERPEQQVFLTHRFHDLRHSAATYLLAAGVDGRIVMEIMGWSQLSMLARYQHVLDSMLDDAAARLEAVFPRAGAVIAGHIAGHGSKRAFRTISGRLS